jgi:citrate synthase
VSRGRNAVNLPPLSITTADDRILVRDRDLAGDLIGQKTFTEVFLLDLVGLEPSRAHVRMIDAVLVALIEHGATPSTLSARLVLDGAPESMQGAVAAGLLATGSRYLGVIEDVASLLQSIVADERTALDATRDRINALLAEGRAVPGLGHNLHTIDPRVDTLKRFAMSEGVAGQHLDALNVVADVAVEQTGRPLMINAAGVIGAILSDLGYAPQETRGFALVARCAGIFAHLVDEQRNPSARPSWERLHEDQ